MTETFDAAVAYVLGYDHAVDGELLKGFRGWLVVRTGDRPEVAWPGQVAHLAFPDEPNRWGSEGLTPEQLEELLQVWFRTLDEFLADRDARGLGAIEVDYRAWLAALPWYDPERHADLDDAWR